MTNDLGGWFVLGMLTAVLLLGNVCMVTMTAWLLIGLIAAVVVAFCKVGIEYVFLTPLVALLIGWVVCMVNVGRAR
jgi:hypothetical protein